MPRYYFHIHDGLKIHDPLGLILSNDHEARSQANSMAKRLRQSFQGTVKVMNQSGREVCRVEIGEEHTTKNGT